MKPERLKTSSGCLFCLGPESVTCPGAELCRSAGSVEMEEVLSKPRFHLDLWLAFTLQNWILDVGRPVVTLVLPADWTPLNRPGAAEYLHILYNISTPLILLKTVDVLFCSFKFCVVVYV
uniref:CLN6 transmembrane ER protein n=1 Tax=Sparus aurata TaxID=8175 RepID=A0A671TP51_SPAAU